MTKVAKITNWSIIAIMATALGFAVGCGDTKLGSGSPQLAGKKKVKKSSSDIESNVSENEEEKKLEEQENSGSYTPSGPTLDLSKVGSIVGFKDNDALVATFAALTRVSRAEVLESIRLSSPANQQTLPIAQTKFEGLFSQLATGESPSQQTPAVVAATTKLSAHYCDALVKNATVRTQVLSGIDFTVAPAALDLTKSAQVLINAFWPMGIESSPDMNSSVQMLSALLGEIRTASATVTPAATSADIIMGGCAVTLTSAPVTML
jgi:hypothetical protein